MALPKYFLTWALLICQVAAFAQKDHVYMQVKSKFNRGWNDEKVKLVSLLPGYEQVTDGTDDFTRSGSYKYLRTEAATGYFHTRKIDGRWWLIDPDGYAAIMMGVTSIPTKDPQRDFDICLRNGFNGIGNWPEDEEAVEKVYNAQNYYQFPYVRRVNFLGGYLWKREHYYPGSEKFRKNRTSYTVVLDPKFAEYCEEIAREKIAPCSEERNLVGWFIDNEIKFDQDQLRNLVRDLPAEDPSRQAALAWAASKGLSEEDCVKYTPKVTEDLKQQFAGYLAQTYYEVVTGIVRRHDPNHMILGSRLHGRPRSIRYVVEASHKYCDVTSVNFYDRYAPEDLIAQDSWTQDKPCMVTEFYVKDINKADGEQSGAGWYVNNQEHRGYFYQNTCLDLLRNKCYVGWHYFRYNDDPDGSNKGMLTVDGSEYTEMTRYMEELNKQVYRLCDYYDGIDRRPSGGTREVTIPVSEDVSLFPVKGDKSNNGKSDVLTLASQPKYDATSQILLKFDLSSVAGDLDRLKHAELIVDVLSGEDEARALFVSGLADGEWHEASVTGRQVASDPALCSDLNRITSRKGYLEPGPLTFELTNYVADRGRQGTLDLKLFNLGAVDLPMKFASREHALSGAGPRLRLVFWEKP